MMKSLPDAELVADFLVCVCGIGFLVLMVWGVRMAYVAEHPPEPPEAMVEADLPPFTQVSIANGVVVLIADDGSTWCARVKPARNMTTPVPCGRMQRVIESYHR